MHTNLLRFSYDAYEWTTNLLRINNNFWNRKYVAKILNSSKLLSRIPNRSRIERIKKNQLRTSRTDYDSTTNPSIYQFAAIRGIRGLISDSIITCPFITCPSVKHPSLVLQVVFTWTCNYQTNTCMLKHFPNCIHRETINIWINCQILLLTIKH